MTFSSENHENREEMIKEKGNRKEGASGEARREEREVIIEQLKAGSKSSWSRAAAGGEKGTPASGTSSRPAEDISGKVDDGNWGTEGGRWESDKKEWSCQILLFSVPGRSPQQH